MDRWVVVLDQDDAVSQRQLDVCKSIRPNLKGVVMCTAHHSPALCERVEYFPAFCEETTNSCLYGLRRTQADFDRLTHEDAPPQRAPS